MHGIHKNSFHSPQLFLPYLDPPGHPILNSFCTFYVTPSSLIYNPSAAEVMPLFHSLGTFFTLQSSSACIFTSLDNLLLSHLLLIVPLWAPAD